MSATSFRSNISIFLIPEGALYFSVVRNVKYMGIFIFIIQEKYVHYIMKKSVFSHHVVQDRRILDEFL